MICSVPVDYISEEIVMFEFIVSVYLLIVDRQRSSVDTTLLRHVTLGKPQNKVIF